MQFTRTQPELTRLALRFSPLVEQSLVTETLLQHDLVDLDVALVDPVLTPLHLNRVEELLLVEASQVAMCKSVDCLVLLVVALGLDSAFGADLVEDFVQFFFTELEPEHFTHHHELIPEHEAVILGIVRLVCLLGAQAQPLHLLAHFGHERRGSINRVLYLDAACLHESLDHVSVADGADGGTVAWLLRLDDASLVPGLHRIFSARVFGQLGIFMHGHPQQFEFLAGQSHTHLKNARGQFDLI